MKNLIQCRLLLIFVFLQNIAGMGQINKVFLMEGTTDFISIQNNNTLDIPDGMTIEAWINPCNTDGYSAIINKNWCAGAESSYHLGIRDGKLDFVWDNDGNCGEVNDYISSDVVINPGVWTHVAMVHTSSSVQLFINGRKVAGRLNSGKYSAINSSNSPILIGVYKFYDGQLGNNLKGAIDEIKVWKRPLSRSEIGEGLRSIPPVNDKDLVLYFNMEVFEEIENQIILKNSAVSNPGINNGFIFRSSYSQEFTGNHNFTCSGPPVPSAILNGTDNYFRTEDNNTLDIPHGMTIEAWIKPCKTKGYTAILNKHWCYAWQSSYHLGIRDGALCFVWDNDGNCVSSNDYRSDEAVIHPGIWTHVAVTHTDSDISLYINGARVSGSLFNGSYSPISNSNSPVLIGVYKDLSGTLNHFYKGRIKDVRIWNTALNPEVIANRYQSVLNGNEEGLVMYLKMDTGGDLNGNNMLIKNSAAVTNKLNNAVASGDSEYPAINNVEQDDDFFCEPGPVTENPGAAGKEPWITIYPVPSSDKLNIDVKNNSNGPVSYKFYDISGTLVLSGEAVTNNESTEITMDQLSVGVYLGIFTQGKFSLKQTIVKNQNQK
jgi:hypothetical protein